MVILATAVLLFILLFGGKNRQEKKNKKKCNLAVTFHDISTFEHLESLV